MAGINLDIKENSIVIEFNDLSAAMKATDRTMSRTDIGYITQRLDGVIECVIAWDNRTWCICGSDLSISGTLQISTVGGEAVTTDQLLTHLKNFKNG